MNVRFVFSEIRYGYKQSIMFMLCVAMSLVSLAALNSFKRNVYQSLISEAQLLHGADIIVHAHRPISQEVFETVTALEQQGRLSFQKTFEFYSVVRPNQRDSSLLSSIKIVEPGYPYYGTITLLSGKDFGDVLQPGTIIVAQELLDRLGVQVGAQLHIGNGVLTIADVVLTESARPVAFFSFGPRTFVNAEDLEELGLMGTGSRAEYELLIKVPATEEIIPLWQSIKSRADARSGERVETAQNARSGVKRFFNNLLFFLSLISIFTLLLGGIGMQGALSAILRQKQKSLAIAKALGSSYRFLTMHYLAMIMILGLVGTIFGFLAGIAVKQLFPSLFEGLLPVGINLGVSLYDVAESMVLGLLIVILFTFLPLYRLRETKPVALFRSDHPVHKSKKIRYAIISVGILFLLLLVIRQLDDVKTGIIFTAGLLAVIILISILTTFILRVARSFSIRDLATRQAVKSLFRLGNASRSIIVTLTSAFAVLLTIFLLKLNLFHTFVSSYPEKAPNLFCLDIQKDQTEQFRAIVGEAVPLFPVIRSRLLSVNERKVDRQKEMERKSDNLGREFNLTYRNALLEDEVIIRGTELFGTQPLPPKIVPVSILDTIGDIGDISMGDRLAFNIQGVEIIAQVVSIRSRTQSKLSPFFYFVFQPDVLKAAPQTLFAALHLEQDQIPAMITRIVSEMPHVSAINVSEITKQLGALMNRLSGLITFFASFSIIAGCLILISAILATHLERVREVVFYKVLGGTSAFVYRVIVIENMILGLLSVGMALILANIGCWMLCKFIFEIPYKPYSYLIIIASVAAVALIIALALMSSINIVRQKPVDYLRQYNSG